MLTEISKGTYDSPGPCWIPAFYEDDNRVPVPVKPRIKCQCGKITGIGLHHVHADGTVTASYFHSQESSFVDNGRTYSHEPGCGWHVFLKLLDYDQGDFPPVP